MTLFTTKYLAGCAIAIFSLTCLGQAQFPNQKITIVVPSAPGGTTDFSARLIAEPLSKALGQTVIVDNKPGASGNIGNNIVAKSKPDGYTLLLAYSGYQVGNPHLFSSPGWHPIQDFSPVAMLTQAPQIIVINPSLKVDNVQELLAFIKNNPEKLNYASSGTGSIQHIAAELLTDIAGGKMKHIPYRGTGPALTDLLSGEVNMFITTPAGVIAHLQSGKLKALAVSGSKRLSKLPNVPTMDELGYKNFNIESWFALYAPAKTHSSILQLLNKEVNNILVSKETITKAENAGTELRTMTTNELADFTKTEFRKWGEIINKANIKAED